MISSICLLNCNLASNDEVFSMAGGETIFPVLPFGDSFGSSFEDGLGKHFESSTDRWFDLSLSLAIGEFRVSMMSSVFCRDVLDLYWVKLWDKWK